MIKYRFLLFVLLFTVRLHPCHAISPAGGEGIVYQAADRQMVENILKDFSGKETTSTGQLLLEIGMRFLGTPYVAHTLENGLNEDLIINTRELDCTTFAENVLALVRTVTAGSPGFERFTAELSYIRYRDGVRNGYLSRLHYFSEWISDNCEKGILRNAGKEIANLVYPNRVDFMSRHPASYQVLKEHPELVDSLKILESEISKADAWYIPKERLPEFESKIHSGDIIAITTNIDGLDVTHVGIAVKKDGRLHLLHASSLEMKVVVTAETLTEYLGKSKSVSGIMVARAV